MTRKTAAAIAKNTCEVDIWSMPSDKFLKLLDKITIAADHFEDLRWFKRRMISERISMHHSELKAAPKTYCKVCYGCLKPCGKEE